MVDNCIKVNIGDAQVFIQKSASLNRLMSYGELFTLPMSRWKEILEEKDGLVSFDTMKLILKKSIIEYESSPNVKEFYYQDKKYWFNKLDRTGLWNLSNCSLMNVDFILGNEVITMSNLAFKSFLIKIELYAYKCYLNLIQHLKAIEELQTIEDIINYDFTAGYPDKVTLNV